MRWGFHQLQLSERMKQYFTFVTPFGSFCYNRLLMGYINATAEFQRQMNLTMGDALLRCAMVMVDDLIIASKHLESHFVDVTDVFAKCAARGHSLQAKKVNFLQPSVEYLGHVCTKDQIYITDKHREAITAMPYPVDSQGDVMETELRSFIGMVQFCRRHIKDCARLVAILNELLTKDSDKIWTELHQLAMDTLKHSIAYSKGLYHIDYKQPIYVCTDGSKRGIGGYLYQKVGGEERPVSYFSRQCTKDEAKWDTRELELLAIICTLENYHHLIDGQHLILQTDHHNLRYLCNLKEPKGRLGRWVLRLSEFDFEIDYRAGKYNQVADALSRNPINNPSPPGSWAKEDPPNEPRWMQKLRDDKHDVMIAQLGTWHDGENFTSRCELAFDERLINTASRATSQANAVSAAPVAQANGGANAAPDDADSDEGNSDIDDDPVEFRVPKGHRVEYLTPEEVRTAQLSDEQSQRIIALVREAERASAPDKLQSEILSNWEIDDQGMLSKLTESTYDGTADALRPFVPKKLRIKAMRQSHVGLFEAHRGQRGTLASLAKRFYWPQMHADVKHYVSTCRSCQLAKGTNPAAMGLLKGQTHQHVLHTLCMDLVGPIRQDCGTDELYVLVMVDPFTHFWWLELIQTKHAEQVFHAFVRRVLLEEGAPRIIHTDNGSEFKNELFKKFAELCHVVFQYSPPMHPCSNQAERHNRTLVETLRLCVNEPAARKRDWHRFIKFIEFAYRRQPIPGTDVTPYMLMRGREPLLPHDVAFTDLHLPQKDVRAHLKDLTDSLEVARATVAKARAQVLARNSDLRDLSQKEIRFSEGEWVRYWDKPKTLSGQPSKLRLRNKLFQVVKVHDEHTARPCRYDLRAEDGTMRENAHASQLVRFRAPGDMATPPASQQQPAQVNAPAAAPSPPATPASPAPRTKASDAGTQGAAPAEPALLSPKPQRLLSAEQHRALWAKLQLNRMCIFVFTNDPPSYLRVAEVVNHSPDWTLITVHFWVHDQAGQYKPELPLSLRKLTPEYQNASGQSVLHWKDDAALKRLHAVEMDLDADDVELVLPTLTLTTGGKVKDDALRKVDAWLLAKAVHHPRARKAISLSGVDTVAVTDAAAASTSNGRKRISRHVTFAQDTHVGAAAPTRALKLNVARGSISSRTGSGSNSAPSRSPASSSATEFSPSSYITPPTGRRQCSNPLSPSSGRSNRKRKFSPTPPKPEGRQWTCSGTKQCTDSEWFDCETATVEECYKVHDCCTLVRESLRNEPRGGRRSFTGFYDSSPPAAATHA